MAACSRYIGIALACFIPLLQAQTPCLVSPPGLVSWWSGDDNTNDLLGGNNPTDVNAVTIVPAEVGAGLTFGTGGHMYIPAAPNLANQRFTWSAWVRPDGPGPNNDAYGSVILQQDISGTTVVVTLLWRATDGRFTFLFGNLSPDLIVSTNAFPAGIFYFVTATYDGAAFRLYVNGVLEGSFAATTTIQYNDRPWTIGSTDPNFAQTYPRTWNGVIDEVEAYNRALTVQEIQAIFNAGIAGTCKGLVLAPRSVVFPAEPVGVTSPVKYVKVVNVATTTVHFTAVHTSGDFSILGSNCAGAAVASGATCYIGVQFTPTQTGPRSGFLAVQSNGPGSPQYIKLTGTGQ